MTRRRVSDDEYAAMLERQDGRCAICKQPSTTLHVDHCHATGIIRALLCKHCNMALGHLRDNPDLCRAAADYLDIYRLRLATAQRQLDTQHHPKTLDGRTFTPLPQASRLPVDWTPPPKPKRRPTPPEHTHEPQPYVPRGTNQVDADTAAQHLAHLTTPTP